MAKAGMRRPDSGEPTQSSKKAHVPKNTHPVPELQGKAKHGKKRAQPTK
ncbi:MAG: Small acid-soluble spore protein P [Oscillospiraceae bacterium]|jgi:hypothetical protein